MCVVHGKLKNESLAVAKSPSITWLFAFFTTWSHSHSFQWLSFVVDSQPLIFLPRSEKMTRYKSTPAVGEDTVRLESGSHVVCVDV